MTTQLRTALERFSNLKNPAIASILKHRGYRYEAQIVEQLIDAYQYEKDKETEECPQER